MTQDEIMDAVRNKPGITQKELYEVIDHKGGVVSRQIYQLMKYKLIRRITQGKTFLLYLTE